jgi:hypothetical protein
VLLAALLSRLLSCHNLRWHGMLRSTAPKGDGNTISRLQRSQGFGKGVQIRDRRGAEPHDDVASL